MLPLERDRTRGRASDRTEPSEISWLGACRIRKGSRGGANARDSVRKLNGEDMLLNSMKVVSFCHVLQGPACTQYLGDMGAQVTKIEPLGGERSRRWAGAEMPGGVSGLYL